MSGSSSRLAGRLTKLSRRRATLGPADHNEFRRQLLETVETADIEGRPLLRAKARHLLGQFAADHGDRSEALQLVDESIALLPGGNPELLTDFLSTKAGMLDADGRFADVVEVCRQGIDVVEKRRYLHTAPYLQSSVLRRSANLYRLGVWAAAATGRFELAHGWTQLARARGLVLVDPESDAFVGIEAQALRATARNLHDENAHNADPLSPRRQLLDGLFETVRRDPPPPVRIEEVQRALAGDQRVISYFTVDHRRLVVTGYARDRAEQELVELDDTQLDHLEALRMTSQGGGPTRSGVLTAARVLEPALFPPRLAGLVDGARRLSVAPHGRLHGIPYAALTYRGDHVIDRFAVALVPTLSSIPQAATADCRREVLALGVEQYDVATDPALSPLPRAIPETEALVTLYRSSGLPARRLDPTTSRNRLLSTLQAAEPAPSSLHLAVHGEQVIDDDPLRSYLFLEQSRFDGIDIASCNLRGTTVVLSACNAGQRMLAGRGMDELPGDDLLGLQAAFFFAGAKQIVASQWMVRDAVAEEITLEFHRRFRDEPADVALQGAINRFREGARPILRSPQFWGPFFLVCNGLPGKRGGNHHVAD